MFCNNDIYQRPSDVNTAYLLLQTATMDIQFFKRFIQRSRSQAPLGPLDLVEHPTWKEIMNRYPFIHDYCDPMTACGIDIVTTVTAFGTNRCPALRFDNGTFHEFSYKKIGMSKKECLKKRLTSAFRVELRLIRAPSKGIHMHIPPYTLPIISRNFLKNRDSDKIARSLVEHEKVGWRLPKPIRNNFLTYYRNVATIQVTDYKTMKEMNRVMQYKNIWLKEINKNI